MYSDAKRDQMIAALEKTGNNVSKACDIVGIDRDTHYKWLKNDPDYRAKYQALEEKEGDKVEEVLKTLVQDKDTTAVIFYCKTKLKNRGYSERVDVGISQTEEVGGFDPVAALKELYK